MAVFQGPKGVKLLELEFWELEFEELAWFTIKEQVLIGDILLTLGVFPVPAVHAAWLVMITKEAFCFLQALPTCLT